jgi:thiol-disulfide isomerase/thioredoxin
MKVKNRIFPLLILGVILQLGILSAQNTKTLDIGASAPDFNLQGVDEKTYTLKSFDEYKILVFTFMANHCPTAQAYEDKIIKLHQDFHSKGVGFVMISPNDPNAVALEEMGYSDLGDTFEDMKIRAADKNFPMPYLYDGDTQEMSIAYGPTTTPHVFIFDARRKLRFCGRIDELDNPYLPASEHDTRNAINALLQGKPVPVEKTRTFGCSVKWADKKAGVSRLDSIWKTKTVELMEADMNRVNEILANNSGKYRLINVWATWCGPCIQEFPEFMIMQRMYARRNFEFVSISTDALSQKTKVLEFLKENHIKGNHFIYALENKYPLIEAIDEQWSGALPYTIIIAPGGDIIYSHQGLLDPLKVRRQLVQKLGRFYADNPDKKL